MSKIEANTIRLASEVMGWKVFDSRRKGWKMAVAHEGTKEEFRCAIATGNERHTGRVWEPYYSIADAWDLVDKLRRKHTSVYIHVVGGGVICTIADGHLLSMERVRYSAEEKTACEAICAAALKTVEAK